MLDSQKMRSALRSLAPVKRKSDSDDEEPYLDSGGRMIIHEEGKYKMSDRKPKRELDSSEWGETESSWKSRVFEKTEVAETPENIGGWFGLHRKEYASEKACGDLKRKDTLEAYTYWPLDQKMVSLRPEHRAAARREMAKVVKLSKKLGGKSVPNALSIKGVVMRKNKKKGGSK